MFLIVGGGSIGRRHLGNLIEAGVREITVVEPREDRRKEAQEHAKKAAGANPLTLKLVASSDEAYAAGARYDGLVIAAPPRFHSAELRRAAEAGIPIFSEKPLATDHEPWDELKSAVALAEERTKVGMVGYNYRFNLHLQQVRKLIKEGAVGRVLSVRGIFSQNLRDWHPWEGLNWFMASKAQGGGVLLEETHLVDICRWLFGEITQVMAFNGTISSLKDEPNYDTDDLAEVIAHFESGAIGSIHMDLFGRYHQKELEVIGEEATLFWTYDGTDIESNAIQIWKGKRAKLSPDFSRRQPERTIPTDWEVRNNMYRDEIRYFMDSCKAGKHLRDDVPTLRDGLQTIAVARAVRASAQSQKLEKVEFLKLRAKQEALSGPV